MCMEIGHALRRNAAGQFGPDLAKKLSQLVKMEKNVMRSMELVGRERMEVAVSFLFREFRRRFRSLMLIVPSNNSPSGERHAMMMFRMSRTSLASCSTRLASLRISMSIVMINTVLLSRASATLRLQSSPAETVCYIPASVDSSNHVNRQAKDHRPNRPTEVQGAQLPQDCRFGAGTCPC